jgi:hypothetical protein
VTASGLNEAGAPPAPFESGGASNHVRRADLHFDKHTDSVRANGSEYQIGLNLGG